MGIVLVLIIVLFLFCVLADEPILDVLKVLFSGALILAFACAMFMAAALL